MNFVLGYVIFFCIVFFPGAQVIRNVKVAEVEKYSVAEDAGIEVGDRITAVNGHDIRDWDQFCNTVNTSGEERKPISLQVVNDGRERTVNIDNLLPPTIGTVLPDKPAAQAGFEPGGRILSVEGTPVDTWQAMSETLAGRYATAENGTLHGLPTEITWRTPKGEVRTVTVTPEVTQEGGTRALVGISPPRTDRDLFINYAWSPEPWLGIRPWLDPVVGTVKKGSPAWKQGLRAGDLIIAVNGDPIDNWYQVAERIYESFRIPEAPGEGAEEVAAATGEEDAEDREPVPVPITLSWATPDGVHHTETMEPEVEWTPNLEGKRLNYAFLGIGPQKDRYRPGILESAVYAGREVWRYSSSFIWVIKNVIFGNVSPKALGGPIAIAQESGKQGAWGWESLFNLIAVLSVSFAVINLVPIPILDGGHILVYLVEGIKRKRMTVRQMEIFQKIGLAILIPLIIFIFYNDLTRYVPFHRIGGFVKNLFQ